MTTFRTPQNHDEEVQKIHADVKAEFPNANPYLKDGLMRGQNTALGRHIFDIYYMMRSWIRNFLPNSSKGPFQKMWMEVRNIQANLASQSTGYVSATGTVGATVNSGETLKIDGLNYSTTDTVTIDTVIDSVLSLERIGTTVTATTDGDHQLATGMTVLISGANEILTNGPFQNIVVIASDKFTYENEDSPASATGTITVEYDVASVPVTSELSSSETNQDGGVSLEFESEISGVDENAVVQFAGLRGGANQETEESLSKRVAETFAKPITSNNGYHVESIILAIPGNTRCWIHYAYPAAGQVTAYFVRDDDEDIIPSATEESETLAAVQAVYNAHTLPEDIFITGPTPKPIDVIISEVTPETNGMRESVRNSVIAFYRSQNDEGIDNDIRKLSAAIYQSYDPNTGERLQYMNLEAPTFNEQVVTGELPTLGSLTVS